MVHRNENVRHASRSCPARPAIGRSKLICLILGVFFFILVNCACATAGDNSCFYSAELLDDGRTVLFTYAHTKYKQKSSGLIFGGSRSVYTKDHKIIGLYHLNSKTTKVIKKFNTEPGTRGRGNFKIRSTHGRKALLYREPRYRLDKRLPGEWFILDVDAKVLSRIPVEKEMDKLGMQSRRALWLAHSDGSIVFLAYSPGQKEGQKNSVPLGHVWLRSEKGRYRLLAELGSYSGAVGGEIFYYDHSLRTGRAYGLQTGKNRNVSNREFADLKFYNTHYGKPYQNRSIKVGPDGKGLELHLKREGSWQKQLFPIDMAPLR